MFRYIFLNLLYYYVLYICNYYYFFVQFILKRL